MRGVGEDVGGRSRFGDEHRFYRGSEGYPYNLALCDDRHEGTCAISQSYVAQAPGYRCGVGSDGLCLIEAGYRVAFADFDNPSTRYLRWRLTRRGLDAEVHDLDRAPASDGGFLA